MYCSNCGKETSEGASFCPYCGAKTAEDMPKIQPGPETVSQAAYVSNDRETEELPVYKRKNKAALIVAFVPLICAILNSFSCWGEPCWRGRSQTTQIFLSLVKLS